MNARAMAMNNFAILNRFFVVTNILCALPLLSMAQRSAEKPRELPPPYETIKDKKQFNAVQFGPGNTFSIVKTPPDFQLNEFAISPDGNQLAMGWGSGRIEIWNLHTKKRIYEFKSELGAPGVMLFDHASKQLIATGSGGRIAYFDLPSGKKSKSWSIPLGKYKYDIQEIVLDPNGRWLAYADEESSKVLDVMSDPPKQLADLNDAFSIALSQDGGELWTVDRSELAAFKTSNWDSIGHWQLKAPPLNTSSPLVRSGVTGDGEQTVAVPSSKGLVVYVGPEMSGEFATDRPTSAVAFVRGSRSYLNLSGELSILTAGGKTLCRKSYKGRVNYAVSEDGQWLALSQLNSVELWRIEDLLHDCGEAQ